MTKEQRHHKHNSNSNSISNTTVEIRKA